MEALKDIIDLFYLGAVASIVVAFYFLFKSGFSFEGVIIFAILFMMAVIFLMFSLIAELYDAVEKLECERPAEQD